jgi:hypothetical protein
VRDEADISALQLAMAMLLKRQTVEYSITGTFIARLIPSAMRIDTMVTTGAHLTVTIIGT